MAIVWSPAHPARELTSLQSEMNRLFSTFFDGAPAPAASTGGALRRWVPAMDLAEHEDRFVLTADLPGLGAEDVTIEVEDSVLTIKGERTVDHGEDAAGLLRVERASGAFSRSLTLPEGVDADAVTAAFDKGVLTVSIPKPAERKPRRVEITVGDRPATVEGEAS